jgi:hypothetical protein
VSVRNLAVGCVALTLGACSVYGPRPTNPYEARVRAEFIRDRDRCRSVAERMNPYVDPREQDAVGARSYRVEAETQACMLSRGWNNPEHDGWRDDRN